MKTKLMALDALRQLLATADCGASMRYGTEKVIAALEADIAKPVEPIEFGTGAVGVHAGVLDERPTLWISTKGAGVVGIPTTHEDGALLDPSDTRCVLRFGNDESLRVVIDELKKLYTTPQEPAAAGWMPIETAPKDGTEVLMVAMLEGISDYAVCRWCDDDVLTGWTWGAAREFYNPIGWMPLPAAPGGEA